MKLRDQLKEILSSILETNGNTLPITLPKVTEEGWQETPYGKTLTLLKGDYEKVLAIHIEDEEARLVVRFEIEGDVDGQRFSLSHHGVDIIQIEDDEDIFKAIKPAFDAVKGENLPYFAKFDFTETDPVEENEVVTAPVLAAFAAAGIDASEISRIDVSWNGQYFETMFHQGEGSELQVFRITVLVNKVWPEEVAKAIEEAVE